MNRKQKEQREKEELAALYPTTPNSVLAGRFRTTVAAIKNRAKRYGLKKDIPPGPTLDEEREKYRSKAHKNKHTDNYKEALQKIEELEMTVNAITALKDGYKTHEIVPKEKHGVDEATAIACLSDVHIGEKVDLEQVQGLNKYNMEIARQRVDEFFNKIVRLTNKERQDVQIHELILFIGGDIIDGALHLDTIMSNEESEPVKQAVKAQEWIASGLLYLEKHFEKITIVCKDGNHGRVTQRLHHSSRQGNSLEWYMYHMLSNALPQFNWINDMALHTYITVYPGCSGQRTLRFHHGDSIGYGGVNGFYTFLNRKRYQWNIAKPADIDVLGHLHQYTPTKRFVVNGSVVGYNSFAQALGAEYERPMQAFFLIDRKRGMTVNIPILFDI